MSELADGSVERVSMPGRVWVVLVGLGFQVLANGFFGWGLLAVSGRRRDDAGMMQFVGYFCVVSAALLVVCVVYAILPRRWTRPAILVIEAIAVVIAGIIRFSDSNTGGLPALVLGPALVVGLTVLMSDDVKDWFRFGRYHRVIGSAP